jgi:hypothetical protein
MVKAIIDEAYVIPKFHIKRTQPAIDQPMDVLTEKEKDTLTIEEFRTSLSEHVRHCPSHYIVAYVN